MSDNVAAVQRRLVTLGYSIGSSGPLKDGVDGDFGNLSALAALAALETGKAAPKAPVSPPPVKSPEKPADSVAVPIDWMPAAKMVRVIVHWTAGAHKASALDRSHYHLLIEGDGTVVRGTRSIKDNENTADGVYAAHTLNCNQGSIGVSLCCMAGAVESPFKAGSAPMTKAQWDKLPAVLAALCKRYGIQVMRTTVLSHAEVQAELGIKQRGKWDISRLAFDPSVVGAKACGDQFRSRTDVLI